MPLFDHFHPPLSERRHWTGFHSRWAGALADALNAEELPENLFAEPTINIGNIGGHEETCRKLRLSA